MRTTTDRIRQAVLFELIGLVLITPLGAWAFRHPIDDIGVIGKRRLEAALWEQGPA